MNSEEEIPGNNSVVGIVTGIRSNSIWLEKIAGGYDGFTRLLFRITNARISLTVTTKSWCMVEELSALVWQSFGHTTHRNERMSSERVHRGGVSFSLSVASDHRDRDRCDQPPRFSMQKPTPSFGALSFSLSLPPSLLSPLLPFSFSFFVARMTSFHIPFSFHLNLISGCLHRETPPLNYSPPQMLPGSN